MTKDELIIFINRYVRNSAVDAFTNDRLNTILLAITGGGTTGVYASYTDFRAVYLASPMNPLKAFVFADDYYGNDEVVYNYIPGVGVMLGDIQLVEPV